MASYRFDPYSFSEAKCFSAHQWQLSASHAVEMAAAVDDSFMMGFSFTGCSAVPPEGTLHRRLEGLVTFVPYPTATFVHPRRQAVEQAVSGSTSGIVRRAFFGQMPFDVTPMQLDWLTATFASGAVLLDPELITKRKRLRRNQQQHYPSAAATDKSALPQMPTGCLHANCTPQDFDRLVAGLHKRLLVDDTGVWYAAAPQELEALASYVQALRQDRCGVLGFARVADIPVRRPYDSVVVQASTSRYDPHGHGQQQHDALHVDTTFTATPASSLATTPRAPQQQMLSQEGQPTTAPTTHLLMPAGMQQPAPAAFVNDPAALEIGERRTSSSQSLAGGLPPMPSDETLIHFEPQQQQTQQLPPGAGRPPTNVFDAAW